MRPLKLNLDKRAWLIGEAATVIDRANALALAAAQAAVLISDVDPRADETVCQIGAGGSVFACRRTDVSGSARRRTLSAPTAH